MKKSEVQIGEEYLVKVSGRIQVVRLDAAHPHGGWTGTNKRTSRQVRIRSAAKLRGLASGLPIVAAHVSGCDLPQRESTTDRRVWSLGTEDATKTAEQVTVNATPRREQAEFVRRFATERHRSYPQYAGYWSAPSWRLVKITRRIVTKLGVAFEEGDVTLGAIRLTTDGWTVYSLRNACNTIVSYGVAELPPAAERVRMVDESGSVNECSLVEAMEDNADSADVVEILEQLGAGDREVVGGGAAPALTIIGI
jgi:hypothetical protein